MHEDSFLDATYEARTETFEEPENETGWPGDGSGVDDLADFNQAEASDYANEGAEDSYLDMAYEDRTECDYGE